MNLKIKKYIILIPVFDLIGIFNLSNGKTTGVCNPEELVVTKIPDNEKKHYSVGITYYIKPLFSREKVISDKYNPTSSKNEKAPANEQEH